MDISGEIIRIIREESPGAAEGEDLYSDCGFDSVSFIELLLRLEDYFSISFELGEMEECVHRAVLIALVEEKLEDRGGCRD